MSFSSKKEGERFFVCKAARLQNVIWDISAHRESPDFIITENDHQFGLEVCEIFAGPESAFGSNMKREEKEIQYYITRFQQKYESISRIPLLVKFVGDLCSENMEAAFKMLVDQNFSDRPFGDHEVIEIDEGRARLRVHVTRSLHASWFSINDRVGRVDRDPIDRISDRVRAKSEKLCQYKRNTDLDDIRLLVVANRIMNSGKLLIETDCNIDTRGFRLVYFLSYPDSVTILG